MLRKALWDFRWTTFWYAVGGAGYTFLVGLFYPYVRQQSAAMAKLIASYPKGVLAAIGYSNVTSFTGFIGVESINVFWPIIVGTYATLTGAGLVAKEVEDGTSEIWLSIPAQRWRLLLDKMVALAIGLLGCVAACMVAVGLVSIVDNATVTIAGLLAMGAVMTAFLFLIGAYSSLLSAFFSSRGAAAGISFGITLGSYLLWVLSGLSDKWKVLKNVSIWTAYAPQKALETGMVDLAQVGILVGLALVCVAIALVRFQGRDAV